MLIGHDFEHSGIFLPLITTNCAVLGIAIVMVTAAPLTFAPQPLAITYRHCHGNSSSPEFCLHGFLGCRRWLESLVRSRVKQR